MTTASATHARLGAFDAIVLENAWLRAVIIPGLGGRVWELHDTTRHRQWIWHREGVPLAAVPAGSAYDDVWAGGWEELYPNDAPGPFEGRNLPDHGEWWTWAWEATRVESGRVARVTLDARAQAIGTACTKEFTLEADRPALTVTYRLQGLEPQAFHFLFKQHLPVAITPRCRLVVPGGQVEAVDPAFGTVLPGPGPFQWPVAEAGGRTADLRHIPDAGSKQREFVYLRDLADGWCGVDDHACRASLRMSFDRSTMPYLWLFLSYGGWRDTYTAVLEPCTNLPKDLSEAVRRGQSARMEPGGVFATSATVELGGLLEPTA